MLRRVDGVDRFHGGAGVSLADHLLDARAQEGEGVSHSEKKVFKVREGFPVIGRSRLHVRPRLGMWKKKEASGTEVGAGGISPRGTEPGNPGNIFLNQKWFRHV